MGVQAELDVDSALRDSAEDLSRMLRRRRLKLGWSQARLAQASGVSRTVVNEVERGRRSPSLGTFDKLRVALGMDASVSLALLPTAAPVESSEVFLTSLAATLVMGRQVLLGDLADALRVEVDAVRTGVSQLGDRLAAVGLTAVDDGVQVEVLVLDHTAAPTGRVAHLEAVRVLTPEALMALVIIGHLGEATRRDIDERRGADSAGLLERLVNRGLLARRTDSTAGGHPNAYRLTTSALSLLGHATVESFQLWCQQQIDPTRTPAAT